MQIFYLAINFFENFYNFLNKIVYLIISSYYKFLYKITQQSNVIPKFNKEITIITTSILQHTATSIKNHLLNLISKNISINISEWNNNNYFFNRDTLYIFLYLPNGFEPSMFPNYYIIWQIEQLASENQEYYQLTFRKLDILSKSISIFDISIRNYHLNEFYQNKINKQKIIYVPLPFYNNNHIICNYQDQNKNIDFLFFGAYNFRRKEFITQLNNKLKSTNIKLKYYFGLYSPQLEKNLTQTKYVLNIHYYDNCCLEGDRINISIRYNCLILSEKVDNDRYNIDLYSDFVTFFDDISSSSFTLNNLIKMMHLLIQPNVYQAKLNNLNNYKQNLHNSCNNLIHKALLSIQDYKTFNFDLESTFIWKDIKQQLPICLHLVENDLNRTQKFKDNPPPFKYITYLGHKHKVGYLGCASSYYNLLWNAKYFNLKQITIFEDDCNFPSNFNTTLDAIYQFLELLSEWDIFNGFICQLLPDQFEIKKMYRYQNITFLEIDQMVGTVFNIYNHTFYNILLKWSLKQSTINYNLNNQNVSNDYFDQFIKRNINKVIIAYPFPVGINHVSSSINLYNDQHTKDFEYQWYQTELQKTNQAIENKITEFLKNKSTIYF